MIDFKTSIHSKQLYLRPMQLRDYEEMLPLCADTEMWYYFTTDLSNKETLKAWIENAVDEIACQKSLAFTIVDRASGNIIGTTRIGNISDFHRRLEIGWTWIAKAYQGTGANGHVKEILIDYLFRETEVLRIEFKTDVLNIPARKAMEKIGLVQEGLLRSHTVMAHGRRRDTMFYSILREEWMDIKP